MLGTDFKSQNRITGIDCLRIFAALNVIVSHIIDNNNLLEVANINCGAYFLKCFAIVAVNCFSIISGYLGIRNTSRSKSFIKLWIPVYFYSVVLSVLYAAVFSEEKITWHFWEQAFFPTLTDRYWYFTIYVILLLVVPVLNYLIEKLNKNLLCALCIAYLVTIWALSGVFIDASLFFNITNRLNVFFMYVAGGFIRKYVNLKSFKRKKLGIVMILFLLCPFLCVFIFGPNSFAVSYLLKNVSPTSIITAVCLLLFFKQINIAKKYVKYFEIASSVSFCTYIISDHQQFRAVVMRNFGWLNNISPMGTIMGGIGVAIALYITCGGIEIARRYLFKFIVEFFQHTDKP